MDEYIDKINKLPSPKVLKINLQALATLDAILMPDWEFRLFSFNNEWDEGKSMGSMRDGEGNEFFILFLENGAIGNLIVKNVPIDKSFRTGDVFDSVPNVYRHFGFEPAFQVKDSSLLFWWDTDKQSWLCKTKLKKYNYLGFLIGDPNVYLNFANAYYEVNIDLEAIEYFFSFKVANEEKVKALNPEISLENIKEDLDEIGYPQE